MKIQIDGTGTLNKGAELMLYSVLEQIESKYPDSTVVFNSNTIGSEKIETSLNLIKPARLRYTYLLRAVLFKLKIPFVYITSLYPIPNINILFDASGFRFGDQWNHSQNYYMQLEHYYSTLKKNNTKIVLLPQAFGPFKTNTSKTSISIINNYVDIVIARESISLSHLINSGINSDKVLQYPDFTSLVSGTFPIKYEALKRGICIIPNKKMLTHTQYSKDQYFKFYDIIITEFNKKHKIFLLNHEGKNDLELCKEINNRFNFEIPIVHNISAKEIKGIINESMLVVSSRFHGVASSLNQAVPCIATSWSHKYELLMKDFGIEDLVLDINSEPQIIIQVLNSLLMPEKQRNMREKLKERVIEINKNVENMWKEIWKILGV